MAIPIYSCLKHPSAPAFPPPLSPDLKSRVVGGGGLVSSRSSERTAMDWRSRCVSTAACVIIGSSIGWGAAGGGGEEAIAGEMMRAAEGTQVTRVVRWSDVRKCPPWHANSLENIVPENLPRPLGGRRSNRMAAYGKHATAPAVGSSAVAVADSCFSV